MRSHSSTFTARSGDSGMIPALLTMTSILPKRSSAKRAKALTLSAEVTSSDW